MTEEILMTPELAAPTPRDEAAGAVELVRKVWKQRFINLCELKFPLRQVPDQLVHHSRCYGGRPAIYKFHDLGHGGSLTRPGEREKGYVVLGRPFAFPLST